MLVVVVVVADEVASCGLPMNSACASLSCKVVGIKDHAKIDDDFQTKS